MASLKKLKTSISSKPVEIWSVTEDKADVVKVWLAKRRHALPTATVTNVVKSLALIDKQRGKKTHAFAIASYRPLTSPSELPVTRP
jgi:predicted transcriptional regulator